MTKSQDETRIRSALRQAPAAPSQEAVPPQSLVAVDRRLQELALWLQGRMMFNEARDVDTARLALASPQGQESGVTKP